MTRIILLGYKLDVLMEHLNRWLNWRGPLRDTSKRAGGQHHFGMQCWMGAYENFSTQDFVDEYQRLCEQLGISSLSDHRVQLILQASEDTTFFKVSSSLASESTAGSLEF